MIVGKSVPRVDAFDKVTGRAKYTDDLCDRSALLIRVVRSTIAHGFVKSVDISEAKKVPGVVRIFTCFDVPDIPFPTAGHPWSVEEAHQDVADRLLLNRHVRYYGDDVAAVVAENSYVTKKVSTAQLVEPKVSDGLNQRWSRHLAKKLTLTGRTMTVLPVQQWMRFPVTATMTGLYQMIF